MPRTASGDVVGAVREGTASGVFEVEDPAAVVAALADEPSVVIVSPDDLTSAVAAARVRLARSLAERARRAEAEVTGPPTPPAPAPSAEEEADADWQAVRFALLILVFALPAGLAVYAVDGTIVAAALPAAALVALGVVVLVHRRPGPAGTVETPAVNDGQPPLDVDRAPAVRAAEAHLRRQQAAWKLSWWERDRPVPDVDEWSPTMPASPPITLVVVDAERSLDETACATVTATAPAAVGVVVLRSR